MAGPRNRCALEKPGLEISGFLRCYDYKEGDESAPHFDRSYTETAPLQLRDEEARGSERGFACSSGSGGRG